VIDCTFEENTAERSGGAIRSLSTGAAVFTKCTFIANRTNLSEEGGAGGLFASLGEHTVVSGCRFFDNETARIGGGLWLHDTRSTVMDCTFVENSARNAGGLILTYDATATVANCLFAGNRNSGEGEAAALYVGDGFGGPSFATIVNCTFTQNVAPEDGGALVVADTSDAVVANCILWGNTPAEVVADPGTTIDVAYSNVQGGWEGTGNIDTDALFADPDTGDFALGAWSDCIDAADNTAVPDGVLTDLAGNPRFRDDPWVDDTGIPGGAGGDAIVDMGAYEFQGASCAADFNADGVVDTRDVIAFLNAWSAKDSAADFNGDGEVNTLDVLAFLNAWTAGC
jgi:predicted outer membrane repeat protein